MPRAPRSIVGGMVYHVLNRGSGRQAIFHKPWDYDAFLRVLKERRDAALGDMMRWIGVTHVRRHHEHYHTRGGGHLYQGRFKSFVVQEDAHFLLLCRYVEATALRAKLVTQAQGWRWSSAASERGEDWPALAEWPVERSRNWLAIVNSRSSRGSWRRFARA